MGAKFYETRQAYKVRVRVTLGHGGMCLSPFMPPTWTWVGVRARRYVPTAVFAAVRRTGVTECSSGGSLRLDACELDHLGPLLGFVGDELAEVGRRERKHCAT